MLLQATETLEELLVKHLATRPRSTAAWLHQMICRQRQVSLRGVYKELSKLEAEGVVVKVKNEFSLRLAWVSNLITFADTAYDVYFDPQKLSTTLLEGQDKLCWHFKNLSKMDMVWTQLMLGLHAVCPGKAMCIWCPHQWFDFAHGERNRQFIRANEISKHRRYHMIGGRTFLDKLAGRLLPVNGRHSFAPGPFEDMRSTYFTVIGDYLITAKLDKVTTERIETLFDQVRNERDMRNTDFQSFFSVPVRAKLTLEREARKAARVKKHFVDYFGASPESIG